MLHYLVRIDYLTYQLNELDSVELEPVEIGRLTAEREVLLHAETLREATFGAIQRLHEGHGSVCEGLDEVAGE